jgi:hypothetical protein
VTLGSHQKSIGASQQWITPRWILDALGPFDLDPAAADPRPWDCAQTNWSTRGLTDPWFGRVWLNPPFDRRGVAYWARKLAQHGTGTALLHARTEAEWFEPVWDTAQAILFLADRIHFHYPDGRRAEANSGAPACLIAFGAYDAERLKASNIAGYLCSAWEPLSIGSPTISSAEIDRENAAAASGVRTRDGWRGRGRAASFSS